jgi:phosphohistidine phosphatase SixA
VDRALDDFGGGRVLIIGHSDTVPALVERLSGQEVPAIAENEYGAIYLIARPRFGRAAVTRLDLPL